MSASKNQKVSDLRTPKGTLDYSPAQTLTQNQIVNKVTEIFKIHNGVPITTPTFELRSILMNKYGEDSKLIYNIEDQGGDICSLRYDLTVPFSRYLSMNRINKMRKYQIGNVFRRDNPSFKTGRLREFIQADFDIVGENLKMVYDAEILKMISDILTKFNLVDPKTNQKRKFVIRINDRRILMGMMTRCNIEEKMRSSICSTIDKSDKLSFEELKKEFTEKGLNAEQIAYINNFIGTQRTNLETLSFLESLIENPTNKKNLELSDNKLNCTELKDPLKDSFEIAVEEIKLLMKYAQIYKIENIKLDLSLARGLEYYTALILEASYLDCDVGSVVGGGRYDNLCKSISTHSVPCVGFSVGISRIYTLSALSQPCHDVFVGSAYGLLLEERMEVLSMLWSSCIKSETFTGKRVNYNDQIEYAKKNNFKLGLFLGDKEVKEGIYGIVDLITGEKMQVSKDNLISTILSKI
jgi:histidyl-tRNA synthetase